MIGSAVLVNLLNPKLTIFVFTFLPRFLPSDARQPVLSMLALSAVFMAIPFVVFAAYGAFAASVRIYLLTRPRVVNGLCRLFAASFVALGAKLAVTDP